MRSDRTSTWADPPSRSTWPPTFPASTTRRCGAIPTAGQPHRVRVLRPSGPDRGAGQVRLLLPRRGPAPAGATGPDPRPRRRRPPRHLHRARPPWRPSPIASGWPARSTRRSTSPSRWPASSPRSTTSPAAARRGTWSPPGTPSPGRTSAGAGSWPRTSGTSGPGSSSRRPGSCGTPGTTTPSWPTPSAGGSAPTAPSPGTFEHHGPQFDIAGQFTVPRSPQGHPVILQAGDSDEGREFAAATADAIFSRHAALDDGQRVLRRRQGPPRPLRPGRRTT